jgi:phosphohistidine phosphatase SixA
VSTRYLVRHAKAGSRSRWDGDDRLRPLSDAGRRQAERLVATFAPIAPPRLLSSPYLRCVETIEPLARAIGQPVEPNELLAEASAFEPVLELLSRLPDRSVLCSHGDVIPETIEALARRGARPIGEPDWRKASVWVITIDDGHAVRLDALAPPT